MLKKLYILQTYLIIFQCNNGVNGEITTSTSTTEPTTDDGSDEKIVSPLLTLLEKMVKTEDEKARELLKIKLTERMYGTFRTAVYVSEKQLRHLSKLFEDVMEENRALKNQNTDFWKIIKILGVRSRLETFVDFIYPGPRSCTLVQAYEEILTSTEYKFTSDERVLVFRGRLETYKMTVASFLKAVRFLHGTFDDKIAHIMARFDPQLPEYNDEPGIIKMLLEFGEEIDADVVKAIQIILEPLPATSAKSV